MNYRHIYHAGNFCDIIKHVILIGLLRNLLKKPKPFAVLDCFAGIGWYNITSTEASKTCESASGIGKILNLHNSFKDAPELFTNFLDIIKSAKDKNLYPGSPIIIQKLLRSTDRLIACELHKEDYQTLKRIIPDAHNIDAYIALKAFIPFIENRGLIFLDPAFEVKDEFDRILKGLKLIRRRTTNICTLIWYPLKNLAQNKNFYEQCKLIGFDEILKIEFELQELILARFYELKKEENKFYMNKCGLMIINPPDIKQELEQNINYIIKKIYKEEAKCTIELV